MSGMFASSPSPSSEAANFVAALVKPTPPSPLSMPEWDLLFEAVRLRLGTIVAYARAPQGDAAALLGAGVLDCVRALDTLHAMLDDARRDEDQASRSSRRQ